MIRVLNIISDTNLGGAGRVLLNYAKYRDRSRFDMSVILPRGSVLRDMLEPMDIPVYEIDGMADRSFDRADVGKLKEMIRRIDPDIVHTHGSLSGRIAARACGKKIVYTRHCAFPVKSYMRHGPGRWANRIFNMHYADRVIAVGESTKEKSHGKRHPGKVYRYDDERLGEGDAASGGGAEKAAPSVRVFG